MAKNVKSKIVFTWRDVPRAVGEDYTGEVSLTVPNQSLTVKEIIDRFSRGAYEIPESDLIFVNDEEIPQFQFMTRIDQMAYSAELRYVIAQRKEELKKLEAKKDDEGNPIKVKEEDYPNLTEPYDPPVVDPE